MVGKTKPEEKPAVAKVEVSSSPAGLFTQPERPRHPWSKDGQFDIAAAYSGIRENMGGLLGIRTGMPRLPSFKVIYFFLMCG